ncbi:hypothetical protein [Mycobacterium sp. URHB0021]
MYGQIVGLVFSLHYSEASLLASEQLALLEKIPNAEVALGIIHRAVLAKLHSGERSEAYRVADWAIGLLDDDPVARSTVGGSALAATLLWRGVAGISLGHIAWHDDLRRAIEIEQSIDAEGVSLVFLMSIAGMEFLQRGREMHVQQRVLVRHREGAVDTRDLDRERG